jgi:hypothetical protein
MTNTIYKYPVPVRGDTLKVEMPAEAILVHVAMQNEVPHVWARVDTDQPMVTRRFQWFGTGWQDMPDGYVGTVHQSPFVWHLFDVTE